MATGGGDLGATVCPLCQAPMEGQDALQLHYLTGCSGYDRDQGTPPPTNEPTLPAPTGSAPEAIPAAAPRSTPKVTSSSAAVPPPTATKTPESCSVQFMWQPLSTITFPKVTLLASFNPGTVELSLDPEGTHYASDHVTIPVGTYEGQLVIGDSYIHPVKEFTVNKNNPTIVLQFEISGSGQDAGYYEGGTEGRYGTGYMQTNPSYGGYGREYTGSQAYSTPAGRQGYSATAYGGYANHQDTDINEPYGPREALRAGGGGGRGYGATTGSGSRRKRAAGGSHRAPADGLPEMSDVQYNQELRQSSTQQKPHVHGDTYQPAGRTQQPAATGAYSALSPTSFGTNQMPPGSLTFDNTHSRAGYSMAGGTSAKTTMSQSDRSPFFESRPAERGGGVDPDFSPDDDELNDINTPIEPGHSQGREGTLVEQLRQLDNKLTTVTEERDAARRSMETIRSQLQDEVGRLRRQLQETPQQHGPGQAAMQRELDRVKAEKERGDRTIRELKDQITALEDQLNEYAGAINDQSKVIRGTAKVHDAELLHSQRFAKKQQLEYAEAISSLKKQVAQVGGKAEEKVQLRQLNLRLTAELEDYRTQTKRLMADLQQKEVEILQLRQQASRSRGSERDHLELELETMKQKCDAWSQEVERLSSLKEELEQAQELISQQVEQIQQLQSDNQGLGDQLQALVNESSGDTRKQAEMTRKAAEYDTLMERLTELQGVRAQLENELGPLREERASILRENALLKEGSDAAKYVKLKDEFTALSTHVEELEAALKQEQDLVQKHENTNRQLQQRLAAATNPEQLQSISDRMERYRQERDQARQQVEETVQLQRAQLESGENLTVTLQKAAEESEAHVAQLESEITRMQNELDSLSAKANEYHGKSRRYRQERDQYKASCETLQKQVSDLRSSLDDALAQNQVQPYPSLDSMSPSGIDYTSYQKASSESSDTAPRSPTRGQRLSESEGREDRTYSPQRYSTDESSHVPRESLVSPSGSETKRQSQRKPKPAGTSSRSSSASLPSTHSSKHGSLSSSSTFLAEVRTKEGTLKESLRRPAELPNARTRPQVVVKRTGGTYERGRLMFLGKAGDRVLAGVHLDLPDGNNDGTLKRDGKRYFRCEPSYGLYLPPDKIYIELADDTSSV